MNCELLMKHNRQVYTCREQAPVVAACPLVAACAVVAACPVVVACPLVVACAVVVACPLVVACAVVVGFDSLPTSCSNIPFNLIQVGHYVSQCVVYLMYCTCSNTAIISASSE